MLNQNTTQKPLVGITCDNRDNTADSGKYESPITYSRAVADAGGLPILLPHEVALVDEVLGRIDALILTGGVDPRTEAFGQPTHPRAKPMDPQRQAFELALLAAADRLPDLPVLGICLGMQLMALHHGGQLHQHLPEISEDAKLHQDDRRHAVNLRPGASRYFDAPAGEVTSWHRQAVADAGTMRVIGRSPDGVIEAIDHPRRSFYLGVQWHPERGGEGPLNAGLLQRLIGACPTSS